MLLSVLAVSSGEKLMAELKHGLKFPSSDHGESKYLSLLVGSFPQLHQVLLPSVTQVLHLPSGIELSNSAWTVGAPCSVLLRSFSRYIDL